MQWELVPRNVLLRGLTLSLGLMYEYAARVTRLIGGFTRM